MLEKMFESIFATEAQNAVEIGAFLLCLFVSLALGGLLAGAYAIKSKYTKSFVITLSVLPAIVSVVIMMVNGNIGAGVAVAGAFSLVRFRSAQGSAKEITAIFLAMGTGLVVGMGYIGYAVAFTLVLCVAFVLFNIISSANRGGGVKNKILKITIPEDLDYTKVFDEVFDKYTSERELIKVKSKNMGSMFALTYEIKLKSELSEKAFIDELRIRNGNLEIMLSRAEMGDGEL